MSNHTASLSASITKGHSTQTYVVTRLLVDRNLQDDCFRAYAYLRWVDDKIDGSSLSSEERQVFIARQIFLVESLYNGEVPDGISLEEEIAADLILNNPDKQNGLYSFLHHFLEILEFDVRRRGRRISQVELEGYSRSLSKAVTDGIQHFIKNGYAYPIVEDRYAVVIAVHIVHMLRDMVQYMSDGYFNMPGEAADELRRRGAVVGF